MTLHEQVVQAFEAIRTQLALADVGSDFALVIRVSGRVNEKDCKVEFQLHKGFTEIAKGSDFDSARTEFLRRVLWNSGNKPMLVDYSEREREELTT